MTNSNNTITESLQPSFISLAANWGNLGLEMHERFVFAGET
jgi:hypothetical protein